MSDPRRSDRPPITCMLVMPGHETMDDLVPVRAGGVGAMHAEDRPHRGQ
jgi:hypothetical protein